MGRASTVYQPICDFFCGYVRVTTLDWSTKLRTIVTAQQQPQPQQPNQSYQAFLAYVATELVLGRYAA